MSTAFSKKQWATDLIAALSNKNPAQALVSFVWAWEQMESGAQDVSPADYNPLNTELHMPGSTDFNSVGVQNFVSYEQGLQANVQVLVNGRYPHIYAALAQNNGAAIANFDQGGPIAQDLSMWVKGNATPVDASYVAGIATLMLQHGEGTAVTNPPIVKNSRGMVANFVQVSQFEPNETEFACGFFAGSSCKFATPPNMIDNTTPEEVDTWADSEYDLVYGSHSASQSGGISIDQLHNVFRHAGNLHYWDIIAIGPGSAQANDIANIQRVLDAGYIAVGTIIEASVNDITGDIPAGNPYEWGPQCNSSTCPTHVIAYVGYDNDALYAVDYANVEGPLQGTNTVRPWPRHYEKSSISNQFATVVQLVGPDPTHPWMKNIPDPANWPVGFNGQNFAVTPAQDFQLAQAMAIWESTSALFGGTSPSFSTGIASAWLAEYRKGNNWGPPLTGEIHTVDWSGNAIIVQSFTGGRNEWQSTTNNTWYKWY